MVPLEVSPELSFAIGPRMWVTHGMQWHHTTINQGVAVIKSQMEQVPWKFMWLPHLDASQ